MTGGGSRGAPEVRIVEDPRALAREAAGLFRDAVREAVRTRGRFSAAIPGGETPRGLFRLLGSEFRHDLPWEAIHLFWTDERAVPPDHARSNFRAAREDLLSNVPVPPRNVHRVHGEIGAVMAADAFERDLRAHFGKEDPPRFDLALLGVGEDGHTASLFPGAPSLAERGRLAIPVSPPGVPSDPRVTLTFPALEGARRIVFLVSGKRKAEAVRRILAGPASSRADSPAGRLRARAGKTLWLIDREAASLLSAPPP